MMRLRFCAALLLPLVLAPTPAKADAASYCDFYAKDFADGSKSEGDAWQQSYDGAHADCLAQYGSGATPPAAKAQPIARRAKPAAPRKPAGAAPATPANAVLDKGKGLVPGTPAWNSYCARKYTSFDPATGNYKAMSGRMRKCQVGPK
jgi:hypothetical protein